MLAGARDIDDDAAAEPRAFTLTKLEDRVLGERATARMAGMSGRPPAPPELVEHGAEGLAGLHRVGATPRSDWSRRRSRSRPSVWRSRGAWHGGTVRVGLEQGVPDAAAEKIPDASEGVPAEKKRAATAKASPCGSGFGAAQSAGAAGTRLAGVDVGSVEASTAAAANDAAVAGGTVPRIELVYQKGVDARLTGARGARAGAG